MMTALSNTSHCSPGVVSKRHFEILSQEIMEDEAIYRIRAAKRVHYLIITRHPDSVFDEDTLCQPCLLVPKLPPFPDGDWTKMQLYKGAGGDIESTISYEALDQIQSTWHSRYIDVLELRRLASYNARVEQVAFEGVTALSKLAIFEWWIPQIERETIIYEMIAKDSSTAQPPIAPTFLGHLTEQGRTIGFLMEKIEGEPASLHNLSECETVLRRLHGMGIIHGDVNRYNFIVERSTGHIKMIDFEHAEPYDEGKAQLEINELRAQLSEETGRGASVLVQNDFKSISTEPVPYYPFTFND
ncbi:hypothetical protein F5Y08DRAFT_301605 [Xylaria arbuscula]|nr:hypothetical protein F5Y08DRAFT_301605 [Xylaria arbuscula]